MFHKLWNHQFIFRQFDLKIFFSLSLLFLLGIYFLSISSIPRVYSFIPSLSLLYCVYLFYTSSLFLLYLLSTSPLSLLCLVCIAYLFHLYIVSTTAIFHLYLAPISSLSPLDFLSTVSLCPLYIVSSSSLPPLYFIFISSLLPLDLSPIFFTLTSLFRPYFLYSSYLSSSASIFIL